MISFSVKRSPSIVMTRVYKSLAKVFLTGQNKIRLVRCCILSTNIEMDHLHYKDLKERPVYKK
jgi:hypothetical protein